MYPTSEFKFNGDVFRKNPRLTGVGHDLTEEEFEQWFDGLRGHCLFRTGFDFGPDFLKSAEGRHYAVCTDAPTLEPLASALASFDASPWR